MTEMERMGRMVRMVKMRNWVTGNETTNTEVTMFMGQRKQKIARRYLCASRGDRAESSCGAGPYLVQCYPANVFSALSGYSS